MRRFRLSTLMLLIVIAALGTGLVVQHQRAARREAELEKELKLYLPKYKSILVGSDANGALIYRRVKFTRKANGK
jgi:hypothetical protein